MSMEIDYSLAIVGGLAIVLNRYTGPAYSTKVCFVVVGNLGRLAGTMSSLFLLDMTKG